MQLVEGRSLYVNVISKSGTTLEPALAFRIFKDLVEKRYGKEEAKKRIIATTDKARGALKGLADAEGYETFVVPDGRFMKEGARIMALDDPTAKMSKSAENIHSRISLLDEDSKIKKSIMRATTDSDGEIRFDPENKPGVSNLLNIYSAFSGASVEEIIASQNWRGYGDLKNRTADAVIAALDPLQAEYKRLIADKQYLLDTLLAGAEKASYLATKTLRKVQKKIGFAPRSLK